MQPLVDEIAAAFADRAYPGDDAITRCGYDRRNGGEFDGPCDDCARMAQFFRGRPWRDLRPADLFRHGQTPSLFTNPAYCYFLPAYLIGELEDSKAMDMAGEYLVWDFGPKPGDASSEGRLSEILGSLTERELHAVLQFFIHLRDVRYDESAYVSWAVENLERAIAARQGSRSSPG
ncbi:MAG TPA: hypothetical protein VND21_04085 [Planctomycetota bacterium]|nr:hypothetical protein [Planctomycetota bacterium]